MGRKVSVLQFGVQTGPRALQMKPARCEDAHEPERVGARARFPADLNE